MNTRRDFLRKSAGALLLGTAGDGYLGRCLADQPAAISVLKRKSPAAIAMWDFSWLLRHDTGHTVGSEFCDWGKALDSLVERGYNAIRLDVFPDLVAVGADGKASGEFTFGGHAKRPVVWGAQHTTKVNPRKALKEFIPLCLDRGLLLGLSTWFFGPDSQRIQGADGLVRVWDETLGFLKENDLLHNIYYVDLLNEYPLFHGFKWLHRQMDADINAHKETPQSQGVHEWSDKAGNYNGSASREFYTQFADSVITRLQAKWPRLDFLFSVTDNGSADWRVMASTQIAALDVHEWFVLNPLLGSMDTGYWQNIHTLAPTDEPFAAVQTALSKNWKTHKPQLVEWMDKKMGEVAELGRKTGKPVGNTEGWGIINWLDHPSLNWDLIKEAAEICAALGNKHGYRFNCTSNFTHPQFPGLWADVAWHRKVTEVIRGG